jgi:hypothetical protein
MRLLTPAVKPPFVGHVSYVLPAFEYGSHALALLPNTRAELHETTVYVRALADSAHAKSAVATAAKAQSRRFSVTERVMCG